MPDGKGWDTEQVAELRAASKHAWACLWAHLDENPTHPKDSCRTCFDLHDDAADADRRYFEACGLKVGRP